MNLTIVKEPDWLLNALWISCGPIGTRSFRCKANLPPTILLSNGKPIKALGTNARGYLHRLTLDSIEVERLIDESGFRGELQKEFRMLRRHLVEFSIRYPASLYPKQNHSGQLKIQNSEDMGDNNLNDIDENNDSDKAFICTATYADGSKEDLTLRTLDILLRNDGWLTQVIMIQGYIPIRKGLTGSFKADIKNEELLAKLSSVDQLTLRLAKQAEKAYSKIDIGNSSYASSSSYMSSNRSPSRGESRGGSSRGSSRGRSRGSPNRGEPMVKEVKDTTFIDGENEEEDDAATVNTSVSALSANTNTMRGSVFSASSNEQVESDILLKIHELEVTYVIDTNGECFYQSSGFMALNIEKNRREVEELIASEKRSRELTAAYTVAKEFLTLLHHGRRRGLSAQDSFVHFDVNGNGYVDTDLLVDGLAKLGMGVTYPVAQSLLHCIGGVGAKFVTVNDFETFCNTNVDQLTLDNPVENHTRVSRRKARALELKQRAAKLGVKLPQAKLFGDDGSVTLMPSQAYPDAPDTARRGSKSSPSKSPDKNSSPIQSKSPSPTKSVGKGTKQTGTQRRIAQRNERLAQTVRKNTEFDRPPSSGILKSPSASTRKIAFSSPSNNSKNSENSSKLFSMYKEMNKTLNLSSDELLHIENGAVMTFRLITAASMEEAMSGDRPGSKKKRKNENEDVESITSAAMDEEKDGDSVGNDSVLGSSESKKSDPVNSLPPSVDSKKSKITEKKVKGFTLIVVPDLFMTLSAMEYHFKSLISRYPAARVVLVGLPGMPNTMWPKGWVLNADLHSRSIAKLIQYLELKNRLSLNSDDPIFFMGFGSGVYSLSRFVTLFLQEFTDIEKRVKAVCIVNGMLKFNKSYQQICKDLKESFNRAGAYEVHELVSSLHFWDEYLSKVGRDGALKKFWGLRRELCEDTISEERAGKGYVGVLEQLNGMLYSLDDFDGSAMLLTPIPVIVVQSSEDVFVNPQHAIMYQPLALPPERIIVEDFQKCLNPFSVHINWLKAGHEVLQERNPFILGLVSNLAQLCGMEPVDEEVLASSEAKQDEKYGIGFDIIALAMKREKARGDNIIAEEESIRQMEEDRKFAKIHRKELRDAKRAQALADQNALLELRRLEDEKIQKESEDAEAEEKRKHNERLVAAKAAKAEEERLKKLARSSKRSTLDEERQRQEAKAKRKAELAAAQEIIRLQEERRCENREMKKMEMEEIRSHHAWENATEMAIKEEKARIERQKKLEQSKAFRAEQERKLMAILERERIDRELFRRNRAAEIMQLISVNQDYFSEDVGKIVNVYISKHAIEENGNTIEENGIAIKEQNGVQAADDAAAIVNEVQIITDKVIQEQIAAENEVENLGMDDINDDATATTLTDSINDDDDRKDGAAVSVASTSASKRTRKSKKKSRESEKDDSNKVMEAVSNSMETFHDLWICRNKLVDSILRFNTLQIKFTTLSKEKESLEVDSNRLRRAIKLIEINPSIIGEGGPGSKGAEGEIADMSASLLKKEKTLKTLIENVASRRIQLDTAKIIVSQNKESLHRLEEAMNLRIKNMNLIHFHMLKRIRDFKTERELSVAAKESSRFQEFSILKRMKVLATEIERIKDHKYELVDTDIYVEGVVQRCSTEELREHLHREVELEKSKLTKVISNNERHTLGILECIDKISVAVRDEKKIEEACRTINQGFVSYSSSTPEDIANAYSKQLQESLRVDIRRRKDREINRRAQTLGTTSNMDKLRMKDPEVRTRDEKRFLGMDIVMNPEAYLHLTPLQAEQMKFDEDYNCELTKADLHRIWKLPEQLALALPFLHTKNEFDAHRLLNLFIRCTDDNFYREKDFLSEGAIDPSISSSDDISVTSKNSHSSLSRRGPNGEKIDDPAMDFDTVHDCLVKESLRNAVRTFAAGEILDEDQRAFLQMDMLICPYLYEYQQQQSLLTQLQVIPSWRCPFGREQLLDIWRGKNIFSDNVGSSNNEVQYSEVDINYAKKLLDKFYVGEEESTIGYARVSILGNLSEHIATALRGLDQKLKEELGWRQQDVNDNGAYKSMAHQAEDDDSGPRRVWGSWEQVHPASAGKDSQNSYFVRSTFNVSRDHPASYAKREDFVKDDDDSSYFSREELPRGRALQQLGLKTLMLMPGEQNLPENLDPESLKITNDPNSDWHIANSLQELGMQDSKRVRGKFVLVKQKEAHILFEIQNAKLLGRQSRSHIFSIPDRDETRILDMTVSIIFQGDFNEKGYTLGRLAAGLFRVPNSHDPRAPLTPYPVGYSPYEMQSPNLPGSLGRLVIVHRPRAQPLHPGKFQLVVGCASNTRYSIIVACTYAKAALAVVDELVLKAKERQTLIPKLLKELEIFEATARISERKMRVCERIVIEAETERDRAQKALKETSRKIEIDNEEMTLLEVERKELVEENNKHEKEYGRWSSLFTSRMREREDSEKGFKDLQILVAQKQKEKDIVKAELFVARRDLPACIAVLRSVTEATYIAAALNTTVQANVASTTEDSKGGAEEKPNLSTPADLIRIKVRRDGFKNLMLEEQQWCMLDQALYPQKYEWLREQEEQEALELVALGKKAKRKKLGAAVEKFRYTKGEIEHIIYAPYSMLTRHEMVVRKLMSKFHDDPEIIRKSLATETFGFDPHLAEKVRGKNFRAYTKEEREWASMDKIVNPEVWDYYVNKLTITSSVDPNARFATVGGLPIDEPVAPPTTTTTTSITAGTAVPDKDKAADTHGKSKTDTISKLGKILGISDTIGAEANEIIGLDAGGLAESIRKKAMVREKLKGVWICRWTKDKILKVWSTPRHKLQTEEERYAYKLLQKYSGSYASYQNAVELSNKRKAVANKDGSHIQWGVGGLNLTLDMDLRARQILSEMDRVKSSKNRWMDTKVLQGNDQRFPTNVLLKHLESQLDAVLIEQIKDRERASLYAAHLEDGDDGSDDDADLSDDPDAEDGMGQKQKQRAERRARKETLEKEEAAKKAGQGGLGGLDAKQMVMKKRSGAALAEAAFLTSLGPGGCLACRTVPCRWKPCVDEEICNKRREELDIEIRRVRADKESPTIVSEVSLSAQMGGNNTFRRLDLLEELDTELLEINRQLQLNLVDKELHAAYATLRENIECSGLHGYPILLWTNNARIALESRQSRLVANVVAREIVDDIMDWMLEGWYFGERESQYNVLGYVPSIKKGSKISAGQDQIRAVGATIAKMKKRQDAKKAGYILDEARKGVVAEKAQYIEANSQFKLEAARITKQGEDQEHLLNETETTMRFGLFMMTLMYFRAMALIKREKRSWNDETGDGIGKSKMKSMTDERMRMMDEEQRSEARQKKVKFWMDKARRGEENMKRKADVARKDAIARRVAARKALTREIGSVSILQRMYRGFIGRRNAKRWALKRAELNAMTALLHQTATIIQRTFRGYRGRVSVDTWRREMAQFIAYLRAQEAAGDEELFWKTHPWARFKKDQKSWQNRTFKPAYMNKTLGGAGGNRAKDSDDEDDAEKANQLAALEGEESRPSSPQKTTNETKD